MVEMFSILVFSLERNIILILLRNDTNADNCATVS